MTDPLVTTAQDTDKEAEGRRKLAILKAVGLDKAAPEQRELAIAIAKRYDLDLMLKHLVLIEGRPYVTRDALLWIAHRDGHLDGIDVTDPVIRGYQGTDYWYAEATVYRSDMSHPFRYGGRYPTKGGNAKFGPEMATKVAESMALRRAFNISAPTQDEGWDVEVPAAEPKSASLAEKVAERAAALPVSAFPPSPDVTDHVDEQPVTPLPPEVAAELPIPESAPLEAEDPAEGEFRAVIAGEPTGTGVHQCESKSPFGTDEAPVQCRKESGHRGAHRASATETW